MTDAILHDIHDLLPGFRARAQETEDARQVPKTSIQELTETASSGSSNLLGSVARRPTR